VECGTPADYGEAGFDLVWAVAVLEHVPSPTAFLADLQRLAAPKGLVVLVQPTQDVRSYDLFFTDHLHHFTTRHLAAYAAKCGFRELAREVGHDWMPNFSLHVWQASQSAETDVWPGPPDGSACEDSLTAILTDMTQLNALLEHLEDSQRRVAAFGLGEVFALARAYSRLGEFRLTGGMDDGWRSRVHRRWSFPVFSPDECAARAITDVLLTMNSIHYRRAARRLAGFDVRVHPVFAAEPERERQAA
jgi:SAM-dependent methyltransferase